MCNKIQTHLKEISNLNKISKSKDKDQRFQKRDSLVHFVDITWQCKSLILIQIFAKLKKVSVNIVIHSSLWIWWKIIIKYANQEKKPKSKIEELKDRIEGEIEERVFNKIKEVNIIILWIKMGSNFVQMWQLMLMETGIQILTQLIKEIIIHSKDQEETLF